MPLCNCYYFTHLVDLLGSYMASFNGSGLSPSNLYSVFFLLYSSPCRRPCKLLPSHGVRCRRSSSLTISSNVFSSETTEYICMKPIMTFSQSILHKLTIWVFDRLKNTTAFTENRTQGSDSRFLHITPKPLGLAKFCCG